MKFSAKFKGLLDFVDFTHEFREVIRVARSPHAERFENDSEHSYQLAMIAWYLIETDKLKLNRELCLMYALAHDLVEIYAGDTYVFDKNKKNHDSKKDRERKALDKIKKRFPKFKKLARIIHQYEQKRDEESKFIYALDKFMPPVQIYQENGKLWNEKSISLDMIIENKDHKIAVSMAVYKYWKELRKGIELNRASIFKNDKKIK